MAARLVASRSAEVAVTAFKRKSLEICALFSKCAARGAPLLRAKGERPKAKAAVRSLASLALVCQIRGREVGGGRFTRQPGQVRKEAALTSLGGSSFSLPPSSASSEWRGAIEALFVARLPPDGCRWTTSTIRRGHRWRPTTDLRCLAPIRRRRRPIACWRANIDRPPSQT